MDSTWWSLALGTKNRPRFLQGVAVAKVYFERVRLFISRLSGHEHKVDMAPWIRWSSCCCLSSPHPAPWFLAVVYSRSILGVPPSYLCMSSSGSPFHLNPRLNKISAWLFPKRSKVDAALCKSWGWNAVLQEASRSRALSFFNKIKIYHGVVDVII